MIWIILATLGIPLWMVAGALATTLWSRRRIQHEPGVFAAKLRLVSGEQAGLKGAWHRRPMFARWVHDVLVIHRGLALVRSGAIGVGGASGSLVPGDPDEIHGLGHEPVILTLILDGGASVELAAASGDRNTMVGPFAGALLDVDGEAPAQS